MNAARMADRHRVSGCSNCKTRKARLTARTGRHLDTMRERSRITSQSVEAHISENEASVGRITGIPSRTRPGRIRGEFAVGINLDLIQIGDRDQCDCGAPHPLPVDTGIRVRFSVLLDGQEVASITECLCEGTTLPFEFTVAEPGTHTVEVVAEGAVTGKVSSRNSTSFLVVSPDTGEDGGQNGGGGGGGGGTPPAPVPDGSLGGEDGGGGNGGQNGGGGLFGGLLPDLGDASAGAIAVLLFVVLAAVAS